MKLSDAIKAGAKAKPQAFGVTYRNGRTCALGAALDAIGQLDPDDERKNDYLNVCNHFPFASAHATHPVDPTRSSYLVLSAIRELNDEFRWTRERIAKWVARVEKRASA